jgi:hypothetical protein
MAIDVMNAANESTLKVVTFTQDQFLKAYKTVASKVPSSMTPSWMRPGRDQSRDSIEKAFDFQAQLLESRKAFALSLLDAAPSGEATESATTNK